MSKGTFQAAKHGTPKPTKGSRPFVPTIGYTHPAQIAPQNPSSHPALAGSKSAENHPAKKGKTPRTYRLTLKNKKN